MLKHAWKRRFELAGNALYWTGAARLFESLAHPTGAIIVMYHSVATDAMSPFIDPPNRLPAQEFERQMDFLHRHRQVVSLSALLEQIAAGVAPAAGTVCITFDDGYLDNLTVAAPILARLGLPATLFLATGYIERAQSQWADVLHWALHQRRSNTLKLPALGIDLVVASDRDCAAAKRALHAPLLVGDFKQRSDLMDDILRQLQPAGTMERLTLNWDEARELRDRFPLFDIGGHTRDHIDLRTHAAGIAQSEIAACREDLDRELGRGERHFCFPYGRWNAAARDLVIADGWRSAMCSGYRTRVDTDACAHSIPRIETPTNMTALRFKTSGAFPGVYELLGKR